MTLFKPRVGTIKTDLTTGRLIAITLNYIILLYLKFLNLILIKLFMIKLVEPLN